MTVSCSKCGNPFDPQESDSNNVCPNCCIDDDPTISDLGPAETRTDHVDLSLTGDHSSVSQIDQKIPKSNWLGREFGDYKIVDRLGKGGMGMVFLAVQESTKREVALKVIRDDRLNDFDSTLAREWVARFKSEALAAARLEHDNIVTVYEVGQLDGNHFFSMQYVPGKSLSQISKERVLTGKEVAKYMIPVCRALQHAHSRGILHRDIKPGNIMVDEQGRPFLTDFGLAKWFEDDDHSMTRSGQVVGTATYMSPQQATDASHATIACDVYSLGATIYRLLAGRPPFDKGSLVEVLRQVVQETPAAPSSFNRAIDADIETIALKCLEKDPAARYQTADELADDLQRFLNDEPISARPVSKRERLWRWCKRNPVIATLSVSAVILLLTTVVVSTVGYFNEIENSKKILAASEEITKKNQQITQEKEETRRALRTSLLEQARGMESSTKAGRRGRALAALSKAANIRPGLDLRNEYARYLDQPDVEELIDIPIHGWDSGGAPYAEAIHDNNRILAVADRGNPIEFNSNDGSLIKKYENLGPFQRGGGNSSFLAKVSNDGTYLAGNPAESEAIEIWDLRESRKLGDLKHADGTPVNIACLVFSEDNSHLYCAGNWNRNSKSVEFHRFTLPELELTATWQNAADSIGNLKIIDNQYLLAGLGVAAKTEVAVWRETSATEPPEEIIQGHTVSDAQPQSTRPRTITFDPKSRQIQIGESTGYLGAFEFNATEKTLNRVPQALLGRHAKGVSSIDVSSDGRWLVSCGGDRQLKIWNRLTGNVVTQIEIDTERAPNVQWLAGGRSLLTDDEDGLRILKFLPPMSKRFVGSDPTGLHRNESVLQVINFSFAEDCLFYVGQGFLSRLDLTNQDSELEFVSGAKGTTRIYVSKTGEQYAVFQDREISAALDILSLSTPIPDGHIELPTGSQIIDVTQLVDGRTILSEFVNGLELRVRQINPAKELFRREFSASQGTYPLMPQLNVASQSGRLAFQIVDWNRSSSRLTVVDLETATDKFSKELNAVKFKMTSDGKRLVYKLGNQLKVVDVETGRELVEIPIGMTHRFDISGDGRFIVTMDNSDGEILLYDANGELQLSLLEDEVSPVWIAISQSGKWLAACDERFALRVWNLQELQDELRRGGVMNQ